MIRQLKFLSGLLLAAAIAACGGGGGSPGTTPGNPNPGNPATPVPATVDVFTSSPTLTAASGSSVSFTVVVKDANNVAIPNQTVTFSASSGNLIGALPAPTTGPAGEAVTTVGLTPGADRTNREIRVTVRAGNASSEVVIPVTGSTLALNGDGSMLLGSTSTFTVRALDAGGQPISNVPITVRSANNNPVTPATVTTDSTGVATFSYRGGTAGNDTVTVTGAGATTSSSIGVSADSFQFTSPAAGTVVAVGATTTVTVTLNRNGTAVANQPVTFSTTRGSITPMSATTNAQGQASAQISSTSSGPANIVAQVPTAQVSLPVSFVATQPASLIVQANPGAVPPNATGSTANQSTILVNVRDPSGNPVANQVVNFTLVTDGSNGQITPGSATTDSSGNAQTQFIPGSRSTANNGVVIQAAIAGTTITGTANVTVNAQALFISIAASNVIGQLNPQTYEKAFSVYVTDANGAPAANRIVNLEYRPTDYLKGGMVRNGQFWEPNVVAVCPNEDVNRNGILDRIPTNEDLNGSGRLEPGLPVAVTPAAVTTGANGFAEFKLQYGENYAYWVDGVITARTLVGGTESVQQQNYYLLPSTEDMQSESSPANLRSPFGVQGCPSPN